MRRTTIKEPLRRGDMEVPKEVERFMAQVRLKMNEVGRFVKELTTASSAAFETIWTSSVVPLESTHDVTVYVRGVSADGTAWCRFASDTSFFRGATGAPIELAATAFIPMRTSAGAPSAQFVINADDSISLQVNDGGIGTLDWRAWIEVRSP